MNGRAAPHLLRAMRARCFLVVLALAIGMVSSGVAASLEQANEAYRNGNYAQAAGLYRSAAREGESPALCYYNAANAYFQLDSLPQAIVFYRACVQAAPDFFKAHLNLAICYYSLNDLGKCLASLHRALKLEPLDQKALLIEAATLRRCGALARAVASFEKIAHLYPQLEEPYVALGEIYRTLGDEEVAVAWLSAYPPDGKNSEYVNLLLADIYERKDDLQRAVYFLNQAFALDATRRWTLYRIALLHRQQGNDLVALETCRKGLALYNDFADMAVLAGTIAFERGRIDEAAQFFGQGVALGSPAAVVGMSNIQALNRTTLSLP